jgi:hypothetical protein
MQFDINHRHAHLNRRGFENNIVCSLLNHSLLQSHDTSFIGSYLYKPITYTTLELLVEPTGLSAVARMMLALLMRILNIAGVECPRLSHRVPY